MDYLHAENYLNAGDVAVVTLDRQANVLLLDNPNYSAYRRGDPYHYYGGLAKRSPCRVVAPHTGHWHVVIDLGGYGGSLRAGIRFSKN